MEMNWAFLLCISLWLSGVCSIKYLEDSDEDELEDTMSSKEGSPKADQDQNSEEEFPEGYKIIDGVVMDTTNIMVQEVTENSTQYKFYEDDEDDNEPKEDEQSDDSPVFERPKHEADWHFIVFDDPDEPPGRGHLVLLQKLLGFTKKSKDSPDEESRLYEAFHIDLSDEVSDAEDPGEIKELGDKDDDKDDDDDDENEEDENNDSGDSKFDTFNETSENTKKLLPMSHNGEMVPPTPDVEILIDTEPEPILGLEEDLSSDKEFSSISASFFEKFAEGDAARITSTTPSPDINESDAVEEKLLKSLLFTSKPIRANTLISQFQYHNDDQTRTTTPPPPNNMDANNTDDKGEVDFDISLKSENPREDYNNNTKANQSSKDINDREPLPLNPASFNKETPSDKTASRILRMKRNLQSPLPPVKSAIKAIPRYNSCLTAKLEILDVTRLARHERKDIHNTRFHL